MKPLRLRFHPNNKLLTIVVCIFFSSFTLKNNVLIESLVRYNNRIEIIKGKKKYIYSIKKDKDYSSILHKSQEYFLEYDEPCKLKNFDSFIFDNLLEDTINNTPFIIAILFVDKAGKIQERGTMRLLNNHIPNYNCYNNFFYDRLLKINALQDIIPSKILNKPINSIIAIKIDINNRKSEIYSIVKQQKSMR